MEVFQVFLPKGLIHPNFIHADTLNRKMHKMIIMINNWTISVLTLSRKELGVAVYSFKVVLLLRLLKASVEVDVMPGEHDPANYTLPQQPLHRCMFPLALRYPTMHCVTNPYECSLDGVRYSESLEIWWVSWVVVLGDVSCSVCDRC